MSIKDINCNPHMIRVWMNNEKASKECYCYENPDSLIPFFEEELRNLGFQFETSNQTLGFLKKNKNVIVPVAIKYYHLAKEYQKYNEQNHFLWYFYIRGLDEVIPMLLDDYYSDETTDLTRWFISDCLYQIRSKVYVKEYLDIVLNSKFGQNRQMIVLLLGKLKEEIAIPILIKLLEEEEIRLHAINALGEFKKEELRCYFERFENSSHSGWRKYAQKALKKLNHRTGKILNSRVI